MEVKETGQKAQHHADRRARELYRYYQPAMPVGVVPSWLSAGNGLSSPSSNGTSQVNTPPIQEIQEGSCKSGSSTASGPSTAIGPESLVLGTSNNTLTSFAQLAALRLNVERAFICVLDRDQQFVLAEATKSMNLNDTSQHDKHDQIWMGSSGSHKAWNLCQDTAALPPSNRQNAHYQLLTINDLSEHERYKQLPFVEKDPKFKFYAGTPLTTNNNINLGCLFVLDSKPRNGLSELERDTLGSLSMLILDYMRICRQASEGRRAARLSRGLSYFVEGSSSFVDTLDPSRADSIGLFSATTQSTSNRLSTFGDSREGNSADHASHNGSRESPYQTASHSGSRESPYQTASQSGSRESPYRTASHSPPNARSLSNEVQSFDSDVSESKLDAGTSGAASSLPEWVTSSSRNRLPPDDSQGNSWCFSRAANLLRESLDLSRDGGVAFFEANNTPFMEPDSESDCSADTSGPATIFSLSTHDEPFSFSQRDESVTNPVANLDRTFLSLLLRRYPKGKLWSFHRDGLISTSDDDDDHIPRYWESPGANRSAPASSTIGGSKPMAKRRKAAENTMLNLYFPNATQIIFVPLWNAVNSQWFSGCFCWTTVETQVFTSAVELSSVLGFGSSVMAEYSRVESLIADRQKGDFIGSISHELRSPLHGILAAAEFLNGTQLSEFQDSLLETVNACGRTLLDTMNQVLDFSKVVSLERTWKSMKKRKETPLDFKGTDKLASHLDTYVATDLAILAEEVVEGICLGHAYGQNSNAAADIPVLLSQNSPKAQSPSNVDVVIDVEQRDWVYRTQPGALRRIIMNLFGNAMKYTDHGRVSLSLEASSHSEGRSRRQGLEDLVILTVSDTGRGISEEFLRGRLYTPFAQEDSLAVGTGLGLSIVRSLVKALNGHIRVRSRPNQGTVVRVSLPLARPVGEESPPVDPHALNMQQREILTQTMFLHQGYPDRKVAIWATDPSNLAEPWVEIAKYMTEWFGLEIVSWPPAGPIDILLVQESDLLELRKGMSATLPALLILCHRSVDYSKARSEWLPLSSSVDIIRSPCGPHKLARSVLKCLQHGKSACVTPSSVLQDPMDLVIRTAPLPTVVGSPGISPIESPLTEITGSETAGGSPKSTNATSPDSPSVISSPPEAIVAAPLPGPLAETSVPPLHASRVLVVDDNRINLNLMITFMKKRRLTDLMAAENGKLAVEAVEQAPQGFDIIFMDMSMPVMNGFEATRAIRSMEREDDSRGPAVIIALTGLSSSRDESEALASGVDMFLTKPVSFKEVSRLLDEWEKNGLKNERKVGN
ncbi:hypothetical protein N7466_005985 [Penicillium verhagenii]|uniref:uncharacterized protein n=1 Tax=Penicillium verhagenii TaxID=1562060 RepID=UPI0025456331|nr:uncharacterized protein N7466_005985 [Penicillium verhagenii]KAJ5930492.1 hypothetical protein N7466_005985 [Penicillium verhagenii]